MIARGGSVFFTCSSSASYADIVIVLYLLPLLLEFIQRPFRIIIIMIIYAYVHKDMEIMRKTPSSLPPFAI